MTRAFSLALLALLGLSTALAAPAPPKLTTMRAAKANQLPDLRLPHPGGDAFLLRPAECRPLCSLVVVSHSRDMTAETSLTRPHLRRLFDKLTNAGFAVLVSNDAGAASWGQPQALAYNAEMRERVLGEFPFSGRTYTLGYSMGGLPALLAAFKNVFPVSGAALIDARVNLLGAWHAQDLTRRKEIAAAFGISENEPLPVGHDPYHDFWTPEALALPVLAVGSLEDQTAPWRENGELLLARSTSRESRALMVTGPHLGGSHFGDPVLDEIVAFFDRLEHLARAGKTPSSTRN